MRHARRNFHAATKTRKKRPKKNFWGVEMTSYSSQRSCSMWERGINRWQTTWCVLQISNRKFCEFFTRLSKSIVRPKQKKCGHGYCYTRILTSRPAKNTGLKNSDWDTRTSTNRK